LLRLFIYKPGMFLDMPGLLHLYGMYGRYCFTVIALNKNFFAFYTGKNIYSTAILQDLFFHFYTSRPL